MLAVAVPADAESRTFNDRTGEVSSGVDIRSLNVNMTTKQLIVTSHHRALADNQQYSYYIDARIGRSGPEYLLSGIVGGHYQLFHAGNTVEGGPGPPARPTTFPTASARGSRGSGEVTSRRHPRSTPAKAHPPTHPRRSNS